LDYREQIKRYTTYGSSFLKDVHPVSKRIHTNFNQVGTATGRFSSNGPNLQNIPSLAEYRACFIADPDHYILSADYSQAELRLAGAITGEPEIITAYQQEIDIHTKTGSMLFKKELDNVSSNERDIGKSFNFARQYGSTPYGIHYNFGLPLEFAFELEERYKRAMPILDAVKTKIEDEVISRGYSITLLGRKRYFDIFKAYKSSNSKKAYLDLLKTRREGFNHVIQGSSADILKLAMVSIFYNNPFGDKLKLILTVHDELECLIHKSIKDVAENFVKKCMEEEEQKFLGEIPAKVDARIGECWLH
jgi:DNA polymerase-1